MAWGRGFGYVARVRRIGMTKKDLIVLTADKDMRHALLALLRSRSEAMGIRHVAFDILVHSEHDPGCARRGVSFLENYAADYDHGLLLFDHEGSGQERTSRELLQQDLDREFARSIWGDRAKTIVVDPELEAWVWGGSPHVAAVAGWANRSRALRDWLVSQGWLRAGELKPRRPKEAFHAALRRAGVARSASLYERLAERVSLENCRDPSFRELKRTLRTWFPQNGVPSGQANQTTVGPTSGDRQLRLSIR